MDEPTVTERNRNVEYPMRYSTKNTPTKYKNPCTNEAAVTVVVIIRPSRLPWRQEARFVPRPPALPEGRSDGMPSDAARAMPSSSQRYRNMSRAYESEPCITSSRSSSDRPQSCSALAALCRTNHDVLDRHRFSASNVSMLG